MALLMRWSGTAARRPALRDGARAEKRDKSVELAGANEKRWTNDTTTRSTASKIPLNIKPPLPLGVSSTLSSIAVRKSNNAFTTLAAGATTISSGDAIYDNTTFRSICPTAPRSEAQACFTTCNNFASKCDSALSSWSTANAAYQKSMNQKNFSGSSSILNITTIKFSDYLRTSWAYDTTRITFYSTVNILEQFGQTKRVYPTYITTTALNGQNTTISTEATQLGIELRTFYHDYATGSGSILSIHTNTRYITTSTEYYSWPFTEPKPSCSPRSWTDCNFSKDCDKCTISGGTVRLLYFPVPATPLINATLASTTRTTTAISTITAKPSTAVYGNTTLTEGTVYISFHSAYANNECGQPVGATYPGAILAMDPKSLRSVNMMWGTMYSSAADPFAGGIAASSPYLIATSLNLADLNWPYDWNAYQNQPRCQNGPFQQCEVVVKDEFFPLLEVPEEIRKLDPEWEKCELDWEGLYDPPSALTPVANAATPTLPSKSVAEATRAVPKSTISSPPVETKSATTIANEASSRETSGKTAESEDVSSVPGKTEVGVEPTKTIVPGTLHTSLPVVVTSAADEPSTPGVMGSASFTYDPQDAAKTESALGSARVTSSTVVRVVTHTSSSSVNVGAIIMSVLGIAASSSHAQAPSATAADNAEQSNSAIAVSQAESHKASGGSPAASHQAMSPSETALSTTLAHEGGAPPALAPTNGAGESVGDSTTDAPAISQVASDEHGSLATHAATITSAPSWTLASPSGVVIVFGSSKYTAVQSIDGEIVIDKTATITAGNAALTLAGGSNGGTLSMQSDDRLIMGNTVQGTGGTLLVDPKETHRLLTASQAKSSESHTSGYKDAVNGDTALVTLDSMIWTASEVSQSVQLGSGVVLATDMTMTTAGKSIWLATGGGIVVASGKSRTTIGFESATVQRSSTSPLAERPSRTSGVTTSTSSSSGSASQESCPYWTTCNAENTAGTSVDATTATATGAGARGLTCRSAWSLTAALCSFVALMYI